MFPPLGIGWSWAEKGHKNGAPQACVGGKGKKGKKKCRAPQARRKGKVEKGKKWRAAGAPQGKKVKMGARRRRAPIFGAAGAEKSSFRGFHKANLKKTWFS